MFYMNGIMSCNTVGKDCFTGSCFQKCRIIEYPYFNKVGFLLPLTPFKKLDSEIPNTSESRLFATPKINFFAQKQKIKYYENSVIPGKIMSHKKNAKNYEQEFLEKREEAKKIIQTLSKVHYFWDEEIMLQAITKSLLVNTSFSQLRTSLLADWVNHEYDMDYGALEKVAVAIDEYLQKRHKSM